MNGEMRTALDELQSAFATFKASNDERLAALETTGHAPAEVVARVERANTAVGDLTEKFEALRRQHEAAAEELNRLAEFGASHVGPEVAKERAAAAPFFARVRRQPIDAVTVSDDDLTALRAYKPAFLALLRRGGQNGDALRPEIRAELSVGVDPEGGYLVPPDMTGRIAELVYESSPIRQIADVRGTRSDRVSGRNDLDEADAGWVAERAARPKTATPDLGKWEIVVHEQYADPSATQKEIDDSIVNIEAWLTGKAGAKLGRTEATAFVSGNGIGKPRGFTDYADGVPSATTWNVVERTKTGVNGAFAASDPGDIFHTVIGKTKAAYLANAVWVTNRSTLAAIRKLKDGDGTYLWEKSFQATQPFTLLGYPVVIAADMPAHTGTGALAIAFGDFRQGYQIVDRQAISLLRDPFTDKPNVHFYMTARVGGDVVNFEAIKLIEFSA